MRVSNIFVMTIFAVDPSKSQQHTRTENYFCLHFQTFVSLNGIVSVSQKLVTWHRVVGVEFSENFKFH